jgi:hypothetical protein
MSLHRKEMGESFVLTYFSKGMEEHHTMSYPRMAKTIILECPKHPTGPIKLLVCTPLNFVFEQHKMFA